MALPRPFFLLAGEPGIEQRHDSSTSALRSDREGEALAADESPHRTTPGAAWVGSAAA